MDQLIEFTTGHPLLVGGFVAVLALLIWTEVRRSLQGVQELSPAQAIPWINDENTVILLSLIHI